MKPIVAVTGPRDAGPGERQQMLDAAAAVFAEFGVADPVRIDVPGRGAGGDDEGAGSLRPPVDAVVPALQSGSLFGGATGVLVVDAQQLLKGEAEIVAGLLGSGDAVIVFVSTGALPPALAKAVKSNGETIKVKKMRERDATAWLREAASQRKLRLDGEVAAALVRRFGSDVAALGQALDQLAAAGEELTAAMVEQRFSNRPDEPMWLYADAVADGDVGLALRRLADFLTHGHPLQLLAFVSGEVRRLALAAAAPDQATYAGWVGGDPDSWPVRKMWGRRRNASPESLRMAVDALARADVHLKTAPEPAHRVMMERLTVALCRWVGARARRAG